MTVQSNDWLVDREVHAVSQRTRWWAIGLLLLGIAVALRSAQFGNAINGLDEQYYLLVGDHMLHGAVPYVDLWDRKPWGLFALFAGIRLLGGDGVVQAQLVATLFATATALVVTAIARRTLPRTPAILAGIFYLVALQSLWGGTTQTPVFYNLPVALAAWLALRTAPDLAGRHDRAHALGAMLLCGLAIQIKTNAVFEGAAIGLWLLWRLARTGAPVARIALTATGFALLGLLPTLAVATGYAAPGHFQAWWFAGYQSQLLKHGTAGPVAMLRLREMAGLLGPVAAIAALGATRIKAWRDEHILVAAWAVVGLVDALALGGFWPHYALPFVVPAAILAGHAFAAPRWGKIAFIVLIAYPSVDALLLDRITAADERHIATATLAAIPADATTRCLFIYEGPVIYYHLTQACLVTRYAFTDHLRSSAEADALGQDSHAALREALAKRPGTILTLDPSLWTERNTENDRIIAATLARDYVRTAKLPHRHYSAGRESLIVWRRRDLVRQLSSLGRYLSSSTMRDQSA
jgi:hypothetical protein